MQSTYDPLRPRRPDLTADFLDQGEQQRLRVGVDRHRIRLPGRRARIGFTMKNTSTTPAMAGVAYSSRRHCGRIRL